MDENIQGWREFENVILFFNDNPTRFLDREEYNRIKNQSDKTVIYILSPIFNLDY